MKIVSKIYRKTVLATVVAFGALMSSCTDYLTIIPADKVVEENFWQTKDQVNGMLATSYLKLLSSDAVSKAIIWGELRSDNMTYQTNYTPNIKNIVEANTTDENGFCNWGIYYEAINYANLVLESAPQVVERDPDFTEGDLNVVMGEMYAMRALSHFYVLRAFRDIPLALRSAKNDSEIPEYRQAGNPLEALDLIMEDLNRAENLVMKSGAFPTREQNCGRITRNAVLAIKADVNLWRAAFATYYAGTEYNLVYSEGTAYVDPALSQVYYDECVQNCSTVIANMDRALEEEAEKNNKPLEEVPYNLIQNEGTVDAKKVKHESTAYDEIFGKKNSSESILELQVLNQDEGKFARGAFNVYGSDGKAGYVVVPQNFMSNYTDDDLRKYSFTNYSESNKQNVLVAKYSAKESPADSYRTGDNWDANWILYRRTDVLLMMAEAMVTRDNATERDFREAYDIVKAINFRSRADTTDIDLNPWKVEKYLVKEAAIELVRKERLLELSYEGKRWFDLVRQALREGNTKNIKFVAEKLDESAVVMSKMSTIDALFLPIHIDELRYNKNLKQNPAYDKENSSTEMN